MDSSEAAAVPQTTANGGHAPVELEIMTYPFPLAKPYSVLHAHKLPKKVKRLQFLDRERTEHSLPQAQGRCHYNQCLV